VDILKQFIPEKSADSYLYGRVTAVSGIKLTVVTSTGLQVRITESDIVYNVGDQLILGQSGSLNNIFIIRKVSNLFPASGGNMIVSTGHG
jgi:hypothetical protein